MERDPYALGKKLIAKLLGYTAVGPLDDERDARIEKRAAETRQNEAPNRDEFILTPHEDPVTDLGAVLDALVGVFGKILASPATHLDTKRCGPPRRTCCCARSWASGIHARLAFQSQFEDSGKTTAMTTLLLRRARHGHQFAVRRVAVPGDRRTPLDGALGRGGQRLP